MEMPAVDECEVWDCAYNRDGGCHALAITVGDPPRAQCDTYFNALHKGGDPSAVGHVGACKMADCRHNVDFECQAPGISVGAEKNAAHCLTYTTG
ncbi:DUF1540 domain-containing protein [Streptomyces sp. FXJ1.4098]|uniref:DUF1540 domain-containing protein n=1 Tax=Streptomyces sp. NPDC020845 TaxID=3365096 RepID=UPI002994B865|nr:DUF1540 domain-containing protein [Streptomyces sp. FXJ1.4098]